MKKEELEEIINSGSGTYDDYLNLGHIYMEEGRFDDLLILYKGLKKRDLSVIEKARILSEEGHALDLSNRNNESIVAYHDSLTELISCNDCGDCVTLKAVNNYYLSTLCDLQLEKQNYAEKALKYFNLIIEKYQSAMPLYEAYPYIAEIYLRTERFDKALSAYKKALELSIDIETILPTLAGIAVVHGKMKNYDKSKEYFAKVLEKAKNNNNAPMSKIYFDMGIAAFENNHFQEAVEYFLNALRFKDCAAYLKYNREYEIDIHWHLGTIAYKIQDGELLITHLAKLLTMMDEEHSYYANTLLLLGHYYYSNDEFEKAREYYSRVIVLKSSDEEEIEMATACLNRMPLNS